MKIRTAPLLAEAFKNNIEPVRAYIVKKKSRGKELVLMVPVRVRFQRGKGTWVRDGRAVYEVVKRHSV